MKKGTVLDLMKIVYELCDANNCVVKQDNGHEIYIMIEEASDFWGNPNLNFGQVMYGVSNKDRAFMYIEYTDCYNKVEKIEFIGKLKYEWRGNKSSWLCRPNPVKIFNMYPTDFITITGKKELVQFIIDEDKVKQSFMTALKKYRNGYNNIKKEMIRQKIQNIGKEEYESE